MVSMHAENARHAGVWLPADARLDEEAGERLALWVKKNVDNLGRRVIITPRLSNGVSQPHVVAALAKGAPRQNDQGNGAQWAYGSGPVVLVWPSEVSLQRAWHKAIDQTIILFEWSTQPSFHGWAAATGAYNAATDALTPQLSGELHEIFTRMLFWDSELGSSAKVGRDKERVRPFFRELRTAGLNEDFVVTYTLALGYGGSAQRLREHYRAAVLS